MSALSWIRRIWIPIVIGIGGAWGVVLLARHLLFEWQVFHSGDASLYITVARGIINGLTPYADLLETKPPGIFLLIALSLWITKGLLLARVAQCIAILAAGIFAAVALCVAAGKRGERTPMIHGVSVLFGLSVALYVGMMGGGLFPESFGAAAAIGYVALLVSRRDALGVKELLLASIALAFAIGFKEPFVLTTLAAALILLRERPILLLRAFVAPVAIAAVAGTVIMAAIGYLEPYVTWNLPLLFSPLLHHIEPRWFGGFLWKTFLWHMGEYSPILLLVVCATLIHTFLLAWDARKSTDRIACVAVLIAMLAGSYAVTMQSRSWNEAAALALIGAVSGAVLLLRRGRAISILGIAAAGYLLIYAPAIRGQFLGHHWLFALPAIVAACVGSMEAVASWSHPAKRIVLSVLGLTLAAHLATAARPDYAARLQTDAQRIPRTLAATGAIDAILDRCGIDRWLPVTPLPDDITGYTLHSPYGPIFLQMNFNLAIPMLRETFVANVRRADVIVAVPPATMPEEVQEHLVTQFSEEPWPCAQGIPLPEGLMILFRHTR